MGIKVERKAFRIGQSVCVTLPVAWSRYLGEKSNKITIIGDDILLIVPSGLESRGEEIAAYMASHRTSIPAK
jgi:hypothetical protein